MSCTTGSIDGEQLVEKVLILGDSIENTVHNQISPTDIFSICCGFNCFADLFFFFIHLFVHNDTMQNKRD